MQNKDYVVLNFGATGQTPTKTSFKKPLIVSAAIILIMIIAAAIFVAVAPNHNTLSTAVPKETYDETATFTKAQKLFMQLCGKQMTVKFIREDYFKDDKDIAIETNVDETAGVISFKDSKERIEFDIIHEEEDSPDTAVNFTYVEEFKGSRTFIIKSGENTYQHFNGRVTNEFDRIEDAIKDHQLFQ